MVGSAYFVSGSYPEASLRMDENNNDDFDELEGEERGDKNGIGEFNLCVCC